MLRVNVLYNNFSRHSKPEVVCENAGETPTTKQKKQAIVLNGMILATGKRLYAAMPRKVMLLYFTLFVYPQA